VPAPLAGGGAHLRLMFVASCLRSTPAGYKPAVRSPLNARRRLVGYGMTPARVRVILAEKGCMRRDGRKKPEAIIAICLVRSAGGVLGTGGRGPIGQQGWAGGTSRRNTGRMFFCLSMTPARRDGCGRSNHLMRHPLYQESSSVPTGEWSQSASSNLGAKYALFGNEFTLLAGVRGAGGGGR
jgi:hypothetical protein